MYNFANLYKKMLGTALCCTVLLTGCTAPYTETPVATNFERTDQQKLQSASHWQLIAEDTTQDLLATLSKNRSSGKLHVALSQQDSPFQQAFKQQLINSLIDSGYTLMKTPDTHTRTVDVTANPVRFSNRPRDPIVGEMTALTGGLWVLKNAYSNVSPGAAMMGAAVTFDAYNYFNSKYNTSKPKTELVVSVSVSDDKQYYANATNVYYTTDNNWDHYAAQTILRVRGD